VSFAFPEGGQRLCSLIPFPVYHRKACVTRNLFEKVLKIVNCQGIRRKIRRTGRNKGDLQKSLVKM